MSRAAMEEAMRLFFAVEVPPLPPWDPREAGGDPPRVTATAHVTLRFLGERAENLWMALKRAGRDATADQEAFPIALQTIGAFPSSRNPRIVWLGVTTGREQLVELERRLSKALTTLGLPDEDRPFVPHVTWRRLRSPRDATQGRAWLEQGALATPLEGLVEALLLKESELAPGGARHRTLATFPLRGRSDPAQEGSRPTSS